MKRLLPLALLTLTAAMAQAFPAVEGLIGRLLPDHKGQITLKDLPAPKAGEPERFAYVTEGGKLVLEGNTPVAQASALGWYLRHTAKVAPFWEGFDAKRLPAVLPPATARVEQTTPYAKRVYFNYCTLSYSCAFWDWKRWEYEIDLMALQGVNMPLQPVGLEGVWYHMLQRPEVGFTEAEAREFLVGPAYFAWQWMTNMERFGGPLPKAFIESHIALGQKIVAREREFGMTPIQQGFTGFVPLRMKEKFPQAAIKQQPPWCGSFAGSAQLDPLDPLFPKLAKLFYAEQKRLFGAYGYYGTDPFHESAPPQPGNEYLANVGRVIYEAAVASDPNATLCMQSWSIRKPILHAIPKEHCLVLDIGGRWRGQNAFDGYSFVIGTIHNFGGRTRMFGNLQGLAGNSFLATVKAAPNCVGMGLFPEAINNNPVYFAMVFDQMWRKGPIDFAAWLDDYVQARYASSSPKAKEAWKLLCETVYRPGTRGTSTLIAARPALNVRQSDPNWGFAIPYDPTKVLEAWKLLLEAAPEAKDAPGYRFDVVDVGRQVMGDTLHALHADVANAYLDGDKAKLKAAADAFVAFALDMDALCGTEPLLSFDKWMQDARAMEGSPADKDLYAFSAACQVTQWGHNYNRPRIYEYAWKEWGGLIRGYYVPRWQKLHAALAESLEKGTPWQNEDTVKSKDYGRPALRATPFLSALADWEDRWIASGHRGTVFRPGDPVAESRRILAKWEPLIREKLATNPIAQLEAVRRRFAEASLKQNGAIVKRWTPKDCSNTEWKTWDIDVTKALDANGEWIVTFTYTHGGARLDIAEVALLQNGVEVSKDAHPGTTGNDNVRNAYTLRFEDPILGAELRLRVKARTHGSANSNGVIQLRRSK